VQAAIAALSFAEGHAASGCRIHVSGRVLTDQAAARADLLKMFALTPYASLKSPIYRAAVPTGSDCLDGETLHRRVQYFAAVDEIHEPPGVRSWVVVQYDIGPDGHARHVQIAASSGAADLDARAVEAATRNVFAPQAKQACVARYYDRPGIVPAPPIAKDARSEPSQCAANVKLDFGTLDFYPKAFADREIEGYALMQFDVAPWGGLGEVQVLKSEPAAAFGQAAQNLMRLGKAAPGQGLRGCVVPIRFKIPTP
jgi:TonB family protein